MSSPADASPLPPPVRRFLDEARSDPAGTLLALDVDGTISEIAPTPGEAIVRPGLRRLLDRLSGTYRLAFLSGREASEARRMLGVRRASYVGSHGLEGPVTQESRALREAFRDRAQALVAAVTADVPEAAPHVETKGWGVAFHYRALDDPALVRRLLASIERHLPPGLRLRHGKKVAEAVPDVPADKGAALAALVNELRPRRVLAAGDDQTDVAMFQALAGLGQSAGLPFLRVAVLGGDEPPPELLASADHRVRGPDGLQRLLSALLPAEVAGEEEPSAGTGASVTIDGSWGEGGGQILRSTLALSLLSGRPARIERIRAGRPNPGLQAQHLTGLRAATAISSAWVEGARIGSAGIWFAPGPVRSGDHLFDVGAERASAGSVSLVAQTVLLPLALRGGGRSTLRLRGGTHVPWSPSFHYLRDVYLPLLASLGLRAEAHLHRWGFYPRGQGEMTLTVEPSPGLRPRSFDERGPLREVRGLSAVCSLPRSIAVRQRDSALRLLREEGLAAEVEVEEAQGLGQGTFIFLVARFEEVAAGFSALGERGKPAEQVGEEAARALLAHYRSGAALDPHLADQALLPLALAGACSFTTSRVTRHLLTNLWVLQQFLPVRARLEGEEGREGRVSLEPAGRKSRPR